MIGLFCLGTEHHGKQKHFFFFKAPLPHYGQEGEQEPDTVQDSPSVAYFIQLGATSGRSQNSPK